MKQYKVVHFEPVLQGGVFGGAAKGTPVEQQLQEAINREAAAGWHFESYQSAHVRIKPGCLSTKKDEFLYYDVLIFSMEQGPTAGGFSMPAPVRR